MNPRRVVGALIAAILLLAPATGSAVNETRIQEQLRCVTCGTSLDVSSAPAALQMKDRIRRELADGRSEREIIDGFVRDFGRQVLATPPKSGFDLWVGWLIPIGLPLLALLALPFVVRAWVGRRHEHRAPIDDLADTDRERVDRELEALDG